MTPMRPSSLSSLAAFPALSGPIPSDRQRPDRSRPDRSHPDPSRLDRSRPERSTVTNRLYRDLAAGAVTGLAVSVALFVALAGSGSGARAASSDSVAPAEGVAVDPPARVVELFTSHGCSSCPRADRLLGELIEADPSLVALEYHVDYWNSLVHGAAGNFVDPFSDTAWSVRQRDYDGLPLDGRPGVYTPQAIVDGRHAAIGSDAARIGGALASTPDVPGPDIRIERDGDTLLVRVAGVTRGGRDARTAGHPPVPVPDTGEVALVRFLTERTTTITGGENQGRELVNHRIVTAVEPLGRAGNDGTLTVRAEGPGGSGEGCAVLVRHGADVPRLAGRLCPDPA